MTINNMRTDTLDRIPTGSMISLRVGKLTGTEIRTSDDEKLGTLRDFYFDDSSWTVRYLVVDTGPWMFGRKILISPESVVGSLAPTDLITLNLTTEQVENSPNIDLDQPVSKQQEMSLRDYYSWPYYWTAVPGATGLGATGGIVPVPDPLAAGDEFEDTNGQSSSDAGEENADPNLRSMNEVIGYHINTTDGEIGHVEDFFIDGEEPKIRFMMVDTRNWLPGRDVLVSPDWIDRVSWHESTVFVNVTKDRIESSPEYDPKDPVTRDMELNLYKHYGFPLSMT